MHWIDNECFSTNTMCTNNLMNTTLKVKMLQYFVVIYNKRIFLGKSNPCVDINTVHIKQPLFFYSDGWEYSMIVSITLYLMKKGNWIFSSTLVNGNFILIYLPFCCWNTMYLFDKRTNVNIKCHTGSCCVCAYFFYVYGVLLFFSLSCLISFCVRQTFFFFDRIETKWTNN